MNFYAVIDKSGLVVNTIQWDGSSDWRCPEGMNAIASNSDNCVIGSLYHQGVFTPPVEAEQSDVDARVQAELTKNALLVDSTMIIDTLQDAVDLEMADEEEKSLLIKWKAYRVLLRRVDVTPAPRIIWPDKPLE